ncbi:MetQ/NlpA family ABC transporter substrate-binding protein [Solibacillus sp. MA9]|uniref:Lipoprotein n=1 Tax=Solibacillus palustris TaxID=2908203 RepID=A0ABS9UH89_9BACL|nr:MetQ/NlpA family ABC transporter substrate-binding protein [Solibacillus sp. MA9]MCH7323729.1 MetQ/NlpA family ABC transporter substrate-binding protein [Solibacillus sp. MA9]
MKKILLTAVTALSAFTLAACGDDNEVVKIGVNGADGAQWPILEEKLEKEGIEIELVEFADYTLPNNALAQGEVDLNAFQHISFLASYVNESGNELIPLGSTVFAPLGLYSEKITDINEIKEGDKIAIPDDPSNQARALRLLESAGFIELAEDFGLFGDPTKITANKLNLDIIPMTAQQTPQVLPDVVAAVINNGIAGQAGLNPGEDPIYRELAEDESVYPYVNIIAARAEDKDNEVYQKIIELYHTEEIEKAIKDDTNGGQLMTILTDEDLQTTFEDLKVQSK